VEAVRLKDFNERVVVVTGGAHGIGREIALAFARRGARVVICDIDGDGLRAVEAEVAEMGRECRREVVDVAQGWQVEEFCSSVYKEFGRVDVLVNNAGVACGGRVECMSLDDWRWIIGVNLWGVIHGCHFFYPRMIEQGGGGHIVNISSAAALAPLPDITAYCATKSGVQGLTETLRAEAAVHGIGVSAICPSFATTNITRTVRLVSGTRRSSPEKLKKKIDRFFRWINVPPERNAAAVMRAVEEDIGVVRVGFGSYLVDLEHRFAPGLLYRMNRGAIRFAERWL
jgi:NAD(P)-dependent dehydrogenase (short-subunit alcohol dehydrogenase family)